MLASKAILALEREEMQSAKAASETATSRALEEIEKKCKEKKKLVKVRNLFAFPKFIPMNKKASTEEVEVETKVSEPEEASANTDAPLAEKTKEPKENVRYRKPKGRRDQATARAQKAVEREEHKAEKATAWAEKKAAVESIWKVMKTSGKSRCSSREESQIEMLTTDVMSLLYRSYRMWTAPAALAAVLIVALGYYLAFVRK